MEIIFSYKQLKKDRKNTFSRCELTLEKSNDFIRYVGNFVHKIKSHLPQGYVLQNSIYTVDINLKTGNFILNDKLTNDNTKDIRNQTKKNHFTLLEHFTKYGLINGEKKTGYWGVKYKRAVNKIFFLLKEHIENDVIKIKNYDEPSINVFFDLMVDFHLNKKNIKYHDNVYFHIFQDFPSKNWLKLNENKFLPAILDKYGIKTKFFIGQLSTQDHRNVNIKVLSYVCKLFGDNFIDYIKMFEWIEVCKIGFLPKQQHKLKNHAEKKMVSSVFENAKNKKNRLYDVVVLIYELLSVRDFLEKRGFNLKLKIKTPQDVEMMTEEWVLFKKEFTKGFKLKISFNKDFVTKIESPIIVNGNIYTPKILKSETDFLLEGIKMKNCMGKQFNNGKIFIYISLQSRTERINLQYQMGKLKQGLSKSNGPIKNEIFEKPISILTNRLTDYGHIDLNIEKYDINDELIKY